MKKSILLLACLLICMTAACKTICYAGIADDLKMIGEDTRPLGDAGRLYIPSLGLSVALYEIPADGSGAQRVTDAADSAAFLCNYGPQPVVADHTHQGFCAIKGSTEGTMAYIKTNNAIKMYIFLSKDPNSRNDEEIVWDSRGNSIYKYPEDGITCYTCNQDWRHVTTVRFLAYPANVCQGMMDAGIF